MCSRCRWKDKRKIFTIINTLFKFIVRETVPSNRLGFGWWLGVEIVRWHPISG